VSYSWHGSSQEIDQRVNNS